MPAAVEAFGWRPRLLDELEPSFIDLFWLILSLPVLDFAAALVRRFLITGEVDMVSIMRGRALPVAPRVIAIVVYSYFCICLVLLGRS